MRPACVLFDSLGTLFSLDVPRRRMLDHGLPREALDLWLERTLHHGLALEATATFCTFDEVARATLQSLILQEGWTLDDGDVPALLDSLGALEPYDDAAAALVRLADAGLDIGVLTNGGRLATERLLVRAGLARHVACVVSIDDIGHWKPRPEAYVEAVERFGRRAREVALVAAHAWDVHGAREAGLTAAWVGRVERRYDAAMAPPHVTGRTLADTVDALLALPPAQLGARGWGASP